MDGKYLKGALVRFTSTFGTQVPNVVVFQYNPETLRHTLAHADASPDSKTIDSNPWAVPGAPGETFSFSLAMDATDDLADPNSPAGIVAQAGGLNARLAALEMLMYPETTASGLLSEIEPKIEGESREMPASQVPAVLFIWELSRILPVRVTSLSITEKLFDPTLNPTHADAQIELRVLTSTDLLSVGGPLAGAALNAYTYAHKQRMALAIANLGVVAQSNLP